MGMKMPMDGGRGTYSPSAFLNNSGSRAMFAAMRRASSASFVGYSAVGDDDAIATVELDMNLCDPGSRYLPARSYSEPCPIVLASGDTHVIERDERS
jgi:riboflavin biosynthesis pyrimidine reductase